MSSLKSVSVNGTTYQVAAATADAYAQQLSASQAGNGAAPSADMITSAAVSGSTSGTASGSSLDPGANVGTATTTQSLQAIDFGSTTSTTTAAAPTTAAAATSTTAATGAAIGGASASSGTPYDGSTGPIGAATASASDPTVTVTNSSSTPRYYKIEASAGSDPESLNNNVFELQPGASATINPGQGFIGAITDQGSSTNATNAGTRQELNFGTAGKTWYDADLERGGATNSTLGPTDSSLKADDGSNSLVGNDYAYLTAGSVNGVDASAQAAADDKKNRVISTQKMTITST